MSDSILFEMWRMPPASFAEGPLLTWLANGRVPTSKKPRSPSFAKALQARGRSYVDINFVDKNRPSRVCNFRILEASGSSHGVANGPNLRIFHVSHARIPSKEFHAAAGTLGLVAPKTTPGVPRSKRLRIPHAVLAHSWSEYLLPQDPKHPETARIVIPSRVMNALERHDKAREFLHNYLQALYLVGNNATQQSLGFTFANSALARKHPRFSQYQLFHVAHARQGRLIRALGQSPRDYSEPSLKQLVRDNIHYFLRVQGPVFDEYAEKITGMLLSERGRHGAKTISFSVGKPVPAIPRYEEHPYL